MTTPIMVCESLPYGGDNLDTYVMPEGEMESMADRLCVELQDEPNLESSSTPAP